ncbi:MAG: aminotransferase class V-fold PLP-dependent enzyme [Methylococcaceae bacterium]|nr:aminotransferase class V-fold PLP-dependent enzyme [Methylococcaceae bacterium]
MNKPIYLDYAATTPVAPEVAKCMMQHLTADGIFANPSSIQHCFGEQAEMAVENARSTMASYLHCKAKELIFTSGATESNNLAIKGIAYSRRDQGNHIITVATEHKAVLDTCKQLEKEGFNVTYLGPDMNGLISIEQLKNAITEATLLVSIMQANNETGVIQDIAAIAKLTTEKNVLLHVDAAQSAGKIAIDLSVLPIDLLSLSAHKFYGPKGIGCLFIRNRAKMHLQPLIHGGGQEYSLRPGTLATHQIAGMAQAFTLANERLEEDTRHINALRQLFLTQLNTVGGISINGSAQSSIANIINISFDDVGSESLIIALRDKIAISSSSACNSGAVEASYVLRAMGIEGERLYSAVRFSFGRYTSKQEIQQAADTINSEVKRLRAMTT